MKVGELAEPFFRRRLQLRRRLRSLQDLNLSIDIAQPRKRLELHREPRRAQLLMALALQLRRLPLEHRRGEREQLSLLRQQRRRGDARCRRLARQPAAHRRRHRVRLHDEPRRRPQHVPPAAEGAVESERMALRAAPIAAAHERLE